MYSFFVLQIVSPLCFSFFFFFNDTATTEIYTLSLHDALPIWSSGVSGIQPRNADHRSAAADTGPAGGEGPPGTEGREPGRGRSEEHTSELQSRLHLVCRLLLEKKKKSKQGQNT